MPMPATMSDAYSALRFRRPVEIAVTPNGDADRETRVHDDAEARVGEPLGHREVDQHGRGRDSRRCRRRSACVATAADERHPDQPANDARSPMMTGIAIVGSASQSLNPIAPNCFSRTATQKIGSEKNRKARSVTP